MWEQSMREDVEQDYNFDNIIIDHDQNIPKDVTSRIKGQGGDNQQICWYENMTIKR